MLAAILLIRSVSVPGTQLDVNLATHVGQPYDAATVARDVRALWSTGRFRDIRVETVEAEEGADVVFRVKVEPQYPVREVRLLPHPFGLRTSLPPGTLITQPRAHDLALAVQRQLVERGYPDATVSPLLNPLPDGRADVVLHIQSGEMSHRKRARDETPRGSKELCACLFEERRDAERHGILDFQASVDDGGAYTIERGRRYTVGRIQFFGHPHYSDAAIRRHFLLDEGVPLDGWLLRQSIVRLNRSGMFEPVDERQVHIRPDEPTGVADITVNLTERKRGTWSFSGPLPAVATVSARLPVWPTYAVRFQLLGYSTILKLATNRRFLPLVSLDRPFTPGEGWRSGFSLAPQLTPRWMVLNYAIAQLDGRLGPRLAGTRAPDLTVADPSGGSLLCESPRPRLHMIRTAAGVLLQIGRTLAN